MKILIFLNCLWLISIQAFSQQSDLIKSVANIYHSEAKGYFKEFAEANNPFKESKENEQSIRYVHSRLAIYEAKVLSLERRIKEVIEKDSRVQNDKKYLSKLYGFEYSNDFPGLPKEYWASVSKKIDSL